LKEEFKDGKVMNGDCLELMKDIADKSIDCIITDPPYGINYSAYRTGRGNIANDDNLSWVNNFCKECSRTLKKGNHLYLFFDPEHSAEFVLGLRENGFKIRNFLTIPRAVKGNGGDRIFQQQFEFCLFATLGKKDEGRKFNQTQILKPSETYIKDKRYNAKEWLYRLPDNWYFTKASEHNSNNKLHPTQKSPTCIETMLLLSTNINEIVLDPFAGSGTTAIACINTNRKFILMEKDENYYEVIKNRIEKHYEGRI
jgi:site-specific DNA-methyltransferase (adenine-specific)